MMESDHRSRHCSAQWMCGERGFWFCKEIQSILCVGFHKKCRIFGKAKRDLKKDGIPRVILHSPGCRKVNRANVTHLSNLWIHTMTCRNKEFHSYFMRDKNLNEQSSTKCGALICRFCVSVSVSFCF